MPPTRAGAIQPYGPGGGWGGGKYVQHLPGPLRGAPRLLAQPLGRGLRARGPGRHGAGWGAVPNPRPSPRMLRNNRISCIHNDSFTGLRSVRLLSLYDNQISTIAPGAFDTLQSLSTL